MIEVVRWPETDVIKADVTKQIDGFYFKTDRGLIMAAYLFPISQLETLKNLKVRVEAAKKVLGDTEAEIYKVSRKF